MTTNQQAELLQLLRSTTLFPPEGRHLLSIAIKDDSMSADEQIELLLALQEEQDSLAAINISEQVALAQLKQQSATDRS